jgi:tRNA(Ile)-lysidine synthase
MENSGKSVCDLTSRVAGTLSATVPEGASILIGLSGGMDSVVLLHVLAQLASRHSWKLSALHVHHGISPRADEWTEFCVRLCALYALPLKIEQVDIAPLRHLGVEAAARELRHAALARQQADFIALAHHQDDQAETMLLQLLRGAGVKGAAAMPILKTRIGAPGLLRPLLGIAREDLLAYAQQHALQWVEDESNADDAYPRNFLRHRVLPVMAQRFPACRATLARSARHFAEAAGLVVVLAQQDAQEAVHGGGLLIARLQSLNASRAKTLLRWFLQQQGALIPQHTRLEEMLRQACSARADAQVCVAWDGWEARCYRGRLYVGHALPQPDVDLRLQWRGEEELSLPQLGGVLRFEPASGEGISLAKLQSAPVTIRLRCGDERLRPDANRPLRTLQYLFQERDVPPWRRARWPLLYCGDTLIALPGIAIAADFRAVPGDAAIRVVWS